MSYKILKQVKIKLLAQLTHCKSNEITIISVIEPLFELNLLQLLKGQNVFPKLYFQNREQNLEIATIGETQRFDDLSKAQKFIDATNLQLQGGVQFNGVSLFILPQIKITKTAEQISFECYVNNANKEQTRQIIASLDELANFVEFNDLQILEQNSAFDFENWQKAIHQSLDAIEKQQFKKVVLANCLNLKLNQEICAYNLLNSSLLKNLNCFHFLFALNDANIWLGATPELLFTLENNKLQTEALAGTVRLEESDSALLDDAKICFENKLVADDLKERLEKVAKVEIKPLQIKKLRLVKHLQYPIYAELNENLPLKKYFELLFPSPAISGLPRNLAKQFIEITEPFDRNWYAGSLGFAGKENAEFCVMLRCMNLQKNNAIFYAGAGIVANSQPCKEWQEIQIKMQTMLKLLQLL